MSKGSTQRPGNREKYAANWERIFGKKKPANLREASAALGMEPVTDPQCGDWGCCPGVPCKKKAGAKQ